MIKAPANLSSVSSYLAGLTAASKTPGIQYVVVTSAGTMFDHASGWADIRRQVSLDSVTTMMAYSMSKTITAVAVLQLVEAGRLDLDGLAERHVRSFPYGANVTIRQLLSHTAGIPNPLPLRWVHAAERHEHFDEDTALASVLHDHPRLLFEPGTKYAYSNIGYWLLGKIVEHASGETFTSYVTERILRRLAIDSRELGYVVSDAARHATGYLEKYSLMNVAKHWLIDRNLIGGYSGKWLAIRSHYVNGPAFGGLVGTATAFGKFLQDQLRDQSVLFHDSIRPLLYEQQRTAGGKLIPMTLGWHVGELEDIRYFYKEGGGGGFHSMMRLYPQAGVGTVVMTNATGFNVQRFLDTIDPLFVGTTVGRSRRQIGGSESDRAVAGHRRGHPDTFGS